MNLFKLSEAANLAVHALAYMAANGRGELISAVEMAEQLSCSRDHLNKVMQRLVHARLVSSRRGPRGGFTLERAPQGLMLLEIVEALDGPIEKGRCGLGVCGGRCALDALSHAVHEQVERTLATTPLSAMPAGAGRQGGGKLVAAGR